MPPAAHPAHKGHFKLPPLLVGSSASVWITTAAPADDDDDSRNILNVAINMTLLQVSLSI